MRIRIIFYILIIIAIVFIILFKLKTESRSLVPSKTTKPELQHKHPIPRGEQSKQITNKDRVIPDSLTEKDKIAKIIVRVRDKDGKPLEGARPSCNFNLSESADPDVLDDDKLLLKNRRKTWGGGGFGARFIKQGLTKMDTDKNGIGIILLDLKKVWVNNNKLRIGVVKDGYISYVPCKEITVPSAEETKTVDFTFEKAKTLTGKLIPVPDDKYPPDLKVQTLDETDKLEPSWYHYIEINKDDGSFITTVPRCDLELICTPFIDSKYLPLETMIPVGLDHVVVPLQLKPEPLKPRKEISVKIEFDKDETESLIYCRIIYSHNEAKILRHVCSTYQKSSFIPGPGTVTAEVEKDGIYTVYVHSSGQNNPAKSYWGEQKINVTGYGTYESNLVLRKGGTVKLKFVDQRSGQVPNFKWNDLAVYLLKDFGDGVECEIDTAFPAGDENFKTTGEYTLIGLEAGLRKIKVDVNDPYKNQIITVNINEGIVTEQTVFLTLRK